MMARSKKGELEARTVELCRELKLPAVARDAARYAIEATRQGSDPLAYLVQLLETECTERLERRAQRRRRQAGFPVLKTFEGFDLPEHLICPSRSCGGSVMGSTLSGPNQLFFLANRGPVRPISPRPSERLPSGKDGG